MNKKLRCPICNRETKLMFAGVSYKKILIRYDCCNTCNKVFENIIDQNSLVDKPISSKELGVSLDDFIWKTKEKVLAFYGKTPESKNTRRTYCLNCGTELVKLKANRNKFSDPCHSSDALFLGCPQCYAVFVDNYIGTTDNRAFVETYFWYDFINFPRVKNQ